MYLVYQTCLQQHLTAQCFYSKRSIGANLHRSEQFLFKKNMWYFRCCVWARSLVIELGSIEIRQIDTQHEWIKVQLQHVLFQEQLNLEVDLSGKKNKKLRRLCWTVLNTLTVKSEGGRGWEGGREGGREVNVRLSLVGDYLNLDN